MRIAALGDIHANLEALRAVLAEIRAIRPDLVLHTGDLIGYGPWPNQTVDLVGEHGIVGVRGGYDESAAWGGRPPEGTDDDRESDAVLKAYAWTVDQLGSRQRNFLRRLSFSVERSLGLRSVALFHASPTDLHAPIEESAPASRLGELAATTGADLHLLGHTHRPFHRIVNGSHFVNAGSVGRPQDGDPRACLAIVDLGRTIRTEFRRIPYDVERVAAALRSARLPAEIAGWLRAGI